MREGTERRDDGLVGVNYERILSHFKTHGIQVSPKKAGNITENIS